MCRPLSTFKGVTEISSNVQGAAQAKWMSLSHKLRGTDSLERGCHEACQASRLGWAHASCGTKTRLETKRTAEREPIEQASRNAIT